MAENRSQLGRLRVSHAGCSRVCFHFNVHTLVSVYCHPLPLVCLSRSSLLMAVQPFEMHHRHPSTITSSMSDQLTAYNSYLRSTAVAPAGASGGTMNSAADLQAAFAAVVKSQHNAQPLNSVPHGISRSSNRRTTVLPRSLHPLSVLPPRSASLALPLMLCRPSPRLRSPLPNTVTQMTSHQCPAQRTHIRVLPPRRPVPVRCFLRSVVSSELGWGRWECMGEGDCTRGTV